VTTITLYETDYVPAIIHEISSDIFT